MPPTPFEVTVNPLGRAATVALTGATFYTTLDGSSTVTFPQSISSTTSWYTDAGSRFADDVALTVSIKVGGVECAGPNGATVVKPVARGKTVFVPDFVNNDGAVLTGAGGSGTVTGPSAVAGGNGGAAQTYTVTDAGIYDVTLSADLTLTLAGATAGTRCKGTIIARQAGSGGAYLRSLTLAGGTIAPSALIPVAFGISAVTIIDVESFDGGTTWYVSPAANQYDVAEYGAPTALGSNTMFGAAANVYEVCPFVVRVPILAKAVGIYLMGTMQAGNYMTGIAASDGASLAPGTMLAKSASTAIPGAAGLARPALTAVMPLAPGLYWALAWSSSGAQNFTNWTQSHAPAWGVAGARYSASDAAGLPAVGTTLSMTARSGDIVPQLSVVAY